MALFAVAVNVTLPPELKAMLERAMDAAAYRDGLLHGLLAAGAVAAVALLGMRLGRCNDAPRD